jgi:hypothetical protein
MIRGSVKDTKDAILALVNGGADDAKRGAREAGPEPGRIRRATSCAFPVTTVQDPKATDAGDGAATGKSVNSQTQIVFAEGALQVQAPRSTRRR